MTAVALSQSFPRASARPVAYWLFGLCSMVFVMVILGGLTRLTDSGLSMVEWQVFRWLPPMSQAEWLDAYEKYRLIPEYQQINKGFGLEGFKQIFWLEYLHRLWGRIIGVAFLVPFLWFVLRGNITRDMTLRVFVLFILGGLQGALGWYMVKSGLSERVDVSQYRLAAHLSAAFVIYGFMLWMGLTLLQPQGSAGEEVQPLRRRLTALLVLISVTIVWGAFVAGLDAGLVYNSFPLMGEGLVPAELLAMQPVWANFFENHAAVQFTHRVMAVTTVAATLAIWASALRIELSHRARALMHAVGGMALIQAGLGISTLLMGVPTSLAILHQGGALVLITFVLWAIHEMRRA